MSKYDEYDETRQKRGEKKGMRESSMAPEVAVTDAESEADDVEVGND